MSVKTLSRRLERTLAMTQQQGPPALRAYAAVVAQEHGVDADELLAETAALLAQARRAEGGGSTAALLRWLAAESGQSLTELEAEADAALAAWREQG